MINVRYNNTNSDKDFSISIFNEPATVDYTIELEYDTSELLKRGKVFSNDMKNAGDKDRDDNKWVEDNNRFNAMIDKLFIDIIGMEYKTFLNKYKFKVFISPNNKVQFVFNTENISREKFIEVYNHMIQYGKYGEDKLKLV